MSLNAIQVRNAKPGRHADGNGLYLLVKPSGARSWVLRVQVDGARRDFGLGAVELNRKDDGRGSPLAAIPIGQRRVLTLAEAREKAAQGRLMAKAGLDPSAEWKRAGEGVPAFEAAARKYHEAIKGGWKNAKHGEQWLSTLVAHAFDSIGAKRVDRIGAAEIQAVLLPIWLTIPETARRVRQRIAAVLDYAHSQGWREVEAPMRAVSKGLPKQPKGGGNFAAMPHADAPAVMQTLREAEASVGRLALQFTFLTAARSGEVRGAKWGEMDLDECNWTIPADRMKAGEAHTIPLSEDAVAVLREIGGMFGGKPTDLVFPGKGGEPISDATMAKAFAVAGGEGFTVHGSTRSGFRDWIADTMPTVPADVAEAALAHRVRDKTVRAYLRTRYLEQRRELMGKWANYLRGDSSNVVRMVHAQG